MFRPKKDNCDRTRAQTFISGKLNAAFRLIAHVIFRRELLQFLLTMRPKKPAIDRAVTRLSLEREF